MMYSASSFPTVLSTILLLIGQHVSAGPTVKVLNGTYEGLPLPNYQQDVFLGVPYAQPPTGNLRFKAPQSLNSTWNGTHSATEYGDICMQYTAPLSHPMSENCLSLNVIRSSSLNSTGLLPVAVWIHGGGLYAGSSRDNNLTNFVHQASAAQKPLIAVSINYRISAFGFLWGSDEVKANGSANNGLRDQRLALHWIQENIASFGGDPNRVTIFGQSAGGLSVGKQLIAYGGRDDGLFHGAIMQSGGMAEKWPYNVKDPAAYTEDLYRNLTETTSCSDAVSPLECLRTLPVEAISAALNVSITPVFSGTGLGPWLTQVDGDFLQDGPTASLEKGHFVRVPIMYSTTSDEATVFMFGGKLDTDEDFRALVAAGGPDNSTVSVIERLYPNTNGTGLPVGYNPTAEDDQLDGSQWKRGVEFHTDVVETTSRRMTLKAWAAAGMEAYSARVNLLPPSTTSRLGSHHSMDVSFIFDALDEETMSEPQFATASKLMGRAWASFVSDLNPNNHGVPDTPIWPAWTAEKSNRTGSNFVFNADSDPFSKSFVEGDDYRLRQTTYLASVMQNQMYY
ncbi:Alpha/Beta hydrolase protein [Colletotrichum phormii]|uniref:Carboxylic ester hydrolase n=1 Tax=Colletotrichum phormii TaxID=359342 RepID=A0AAI9ZK58_9PEZI|nr:Alpha/Beta hydrolase protein [Colletotrichum phormii]KAK1625753.1 Alpha/Beta hydrolase protein [Colletotrichum phormii]